jgi:hypothetical protein
MPFFISNSMADSELVTGQQIRSKLPATAEEALSQLWIIDGSTDGDTTDHHRG